MPFPPTRRSPWLPCCLLWLLWLAPVAAAPPPPIDLPQRLAPLVEAVRQYFAPAPTRVLSVRGDTIFLEPVPGMQVGDRYVIYPSGTILAGPNLTSPLPEPLGEVTLTELGADATLATWRSTPRDLPMFAPSARPVHGRILTLVFQADDPKLTSVAEGWNLWGELYRQLFAQLHIPLSGHTPEDMTIGAILDTRGLVMEPPTDILILRLAPDALQAELRAVGAAAGQSLVVPLPFTGPELLPVFGLGLNELIPDKVSPGNVRRYRLPEFPCDCAWTPPALGASMLWCLSATGLHGYRVTPEGLLTSAHEPILWPQHPPYGRDRVGRLGFVMDGDIWELWVHYGRGGQGTQFAWEQGRWHARGILSGVPLASPSNGGFLLANPMPAPAAGAARYDLSGATWRPDATPRAVTHLPTSSLPVIDARMLADHLLTLDAAGAVQLRDLTGGIRGSLPGPFAGGLWVEGHTAWTGRGDRLVQLVLDPATEKLQLKGESPAFPGQLRSVCGRSSDPNNAWFYVLVDAPDGTVELVALPAEGWGDS